jgi:hypothetical protein
MTQLIQARIADIKYDIEGDLDKAISFLQRAKTQYLKEGWSNIQIDIDTERDYGDSSYANVWLNGARAETEAEAKARIERAEQIKTYQERRDREQYEALKAKFG